MSIYVRDDDDDYYYCYILHCVCFFILHLGSSEFLVSDIAVVAIVLTEARVEAPQLVVD